MNGFLIASGLTAAFVTFGHFVFGIRWYLQPMLNAGFPDIPKKVMHAVFHYVTVFLILSTLALLAAGAGYLSNPGLLVRFIALNYFLFGCWQLFLIFTSGIPGAVYRMFQWVLFLVIAVCAWAGVW